MSCDWKKVTIQDITTTLGDGLHGTPTYDELGEYYFINGNNLQNGIVEYNNKTKRVPKEEFIKYQKKINERTIFISINGTLGNLAFYNQEKIVLGKSVCYLNVRKGINKIYIYYVLKDKIFQNYIYNLATGSTIKNASLKLIRNFEFFLPSVANQDKIAKILGDLDKKIELNTQINQTLEEMAQAIFKNWFVDFAPVKAKMAVLEAGGTAEQAGLAAMCAISGKSAEQLIELQQKAPENYQQLATTATLFPSAMQESELGDIPEGWEVSCIGDSYKVTMGQSPKGETYNENQIGTLFYQGRAEFGWRYPTPRMYTTDPKRMADKDDVLMSVRAPVGDLNIALEKCCIGRGLSALKHNSNSLTFTYYQLKQLQSQFERFNAEGTVFGSINQKDLKELSIIQPHNELINQFTHKVSAIDLLIESNSEEIISLISIRDTLLPKLLSGKLI